MRGHAYGPEPSRARHLLVLGTAALTLAGLVALGMVVIGLATGEDPPQGDTGNSSTSTTSTNGGEGSGGRSGQWQTDPATGLPIGASSRDGHPVGFPRTEEGAAAMVVELNRAQIGLDYDTALTTIRVYADPEDQAVFDELATSAVAQRRENLGVPAQGEVNAPAGYAQTPIGYQVEEYGPDSYLVSVLNEVTTTTANGQVARSAYLGQQFVGWNSDAHDGGDWRVVEPSEADLDQLLATPLPAVAQLGTPEFEQAGWTPLLDPSTPNISGGAADPSVDAGSQ